MNECVTDWRAFCQTLEVGKENKHEANADCCLLIHMCKKHSLYVCVCMVLYLYLDLCMRVCVSVCLCVCYTPTCKNASSLSVALRKQRIAEWADFGEAQQKQQTA